jgi:hypothetical protein
MFLSLCDDDDGRQASRGDRCQSCGTQTTSGACRNIGIRSVVSVKCAWDARGVRGSGLMRQRPIASRLAHIARRGVETSSSLAKFRGGSERGGGHPACAALRLAAALFGRTHPSCSTLHDAFVRGRCLVLVLDADSSAPPRMHPQDKPAASTWEN